MSRADKVAFGPKIPTRAAARHEAYAALDRSASPGEYPRILSGGEQQRVALARPVAPRPRMLVMDKRFSGLDPFTFAIAPLGPNRAVKMENRQWD